MNYYIIMADIIHSAQKDAAILMPGFQKLVSFLNKSNKSKMLSPLTITLGDEFQGIVDSAEHGIELIFAIEELILQREIDIKLRYVLYLGKVETPINKKVAYEMLGRGLTEARQQLNKRKREESRFFICTAKNKTTDYFSNKAFFIYQSIVDDWKPKDKITVTEFLKHHDYKIVAKRANTNISSAWRRKKSLKINEYISVKELILYLAQK